MKTVNSVGMSLFIRIKVVYLSRAVNCKPFYRDYLLTSVSYFHDVMLHVIFSDAGHNILGLTPYRFDFVETNALVLTSHQCMYVQIRRVLCLTPCPCNFAAVLKHTVFDKVSM